MFLVAANCSFVAQGNSILYKCNGIMFPLPPVSTLYTVLLKLGLMLFLEFLVLLTVYYCK